jgi:hypothetical protein
MEIGLRFIHIRVVLVFHPWVYWFLGDGLLRSGNNGTFNNQLCNICAFWILNNSSFYFDKKNKICLFQPKTNGNFFVSLSENSTKFAKYFQNLAKFSISQNWKGEKKNPTKQLIELLGFLL